jgi:uncharacterized OsmC-like protein
MRPNLEAPASSHELFVIPRGNGDGFQASVRGHILDLIDPSSYALAPTPDDLFVVSIAAALAWSARSFLRSAGLPDYASVSAEWQAHEAVPTPVDITLTVTISRRAEEVSAALAAALESSLAGRRLADPVVRISLEGADR